MNSVKLYSNGSAVITKEFELNGKTPLKVSIPVKKDDLDDVVSSISVFGDVTLPNPPSYTPTNSNPTTLSLDSQNVTRELATKLRGAEVEIGQVTGASVKGILYGIQVYQQEVNGTTFERFRILVGTPQGIKQLEESSVSFIRYLDESIQNEINKSLVASLASIKPDSRNIDLTIVANSDSKGVAVAYATPCAAWKTRYQLRLLKGVATLEGQAVVDNDTDDNWNDVMLSVITGEPISFSTDIADIRRPSRPRVNVVSDNTAGAVNAEEAIYAKSIIRQASASAARRPQQYALSAVAESFGDRNSEDSETNFGESGAVPPRFGGAANFQGAEVKESGDFSVFTSPNPVTIPSRKSAIIGLFSLPLEEAKTILLYKPNKNERRPYTAIKFKNTTSNSLQKGVCEVYVDGDRQGKCVLENTAKNEESFLVHAVETGVKVFREVGNTESRRIRIKISEGTAYVEQCSTREVSYRVQNNKGESFQFEIEHSRQWNGSKLEVSVDGGQQTSVDIPSGCRISTVLPGSNENNFLNATLVVTVKETRLDNQVYSINALNNGPRWLQQNLIVSENPLGRNKNIKDIIELQQNYDNIRKEVEDSEAEFVTLRDEQERVVGLIASVHDEQANKYKTEIAEAEMAIKNLKKVKLPELNKNLKLAEKAVLTALLKLKTEWGSEDAITDEQGNK